MKHPLFLCTFALSLGLAGASSLPAQTALPSPSPAASLAADPTSVAASPTPLTSTSSVAASPAVGGKHHHAVSQKVLEKYDTNKNGQLDPEEKHAMKKDRAARHAERLKKYDKNGDGKLDDTEKAAMLADRKAEKRANKGL